MLTAVFRRCAGFSLGGALSELGGVWAAGEWPASSVLTVNQGAPMGGNDQVGEGGSTSAAAPTPQCPLRPLGPDGPEHSTTRTNLDTHTHNAARMRSTSSWPRPQLGVPTSMCTRRTRSPRCRRCLALSRCRAASGSPTRRASFSRSVPGSRGRCSRVQCSRSRGVATAG